MTTRDPDREVEEPIPVLTLATDELVTKHPEDDDPSKLMGEDVEDDLDFDPEAPLETLEEEPDGETGA